MKFNSMMVKVFLGSLVDKDQSLSGDIRSIVDSGFKETEGGYLIGCYSANDNTPYTVENFLDKTGYECFINHLRTNDFYEKDLLKYSLLIIFETFTKWRKEIDDVHLNAILVVSGSNYHIKFHAIRSNERYLDEDLDGYVDDAIIELHSGENIL